MNKLKIEDCKPILDIIENLQQFWENEKLHTIYNLLDNFEKYIFSEFCYNLKVPFDYIMKNESNDKINELFNEIDAIKLVKVQIFGTKYIKYIEISISKLVSFIKEENNKQFFTDGGESFYKFKPTIKSYIYRQLDIMNI